MGLKETIAGAVSAGFTALGNLKEDVTYNVFQTTSSYDPDTGTAVRKETSYTVPGLFLEYKKQDIDGVQIKAHDQKFLFQQKDLAVTPTLQDRIVRASGATWEVISVSQDPANVTWEVQVRTTNG